MTDQAQQHDTNGETRGPQEDTPSYPDLEAGAHGPLPKPRRALFKRHREPLPFKERCLRVTWAWFLCTMSTGAIASLIAQQPFTFPGLMTIGRVFYVLMLVLLAAFSGLIATRFASKPRALTTSLHHPSESFFFGAFWVTVALVINGAQAYGAPVFGGAEWFGTAMRVAFWGYLACAGVVAVLQYHIIFEVERLPPSEAVPAWILPAYPFLVTGTMAASIAEGQPSRESAARMIVAGVMGQGLGWVLALLVYSVFLARLIGHSMPAPAARPGMYVSVGPAAFTCAGLLALGRQAGAVLPDGFGGVEGVAAGRVWRAASVPAGMFLWLVAVWFCALTTVSVLRVARRMRFAIQWWGFIVPNAGLGIATIQVGEAVGSRALQGVGSGITAVLVVLYFVCAAGHVRAVWNRDLLAVGRDLGVEEVNRRHEEKKRRGRWTGGNGEDRLEEEEEEED